MTQNIYSPFMNIPESIRLFFEVAEPLIMKKYKKDKFKRDDNGRLKIVQQIDKFKPKYDENVSFRIQIYDALSNTNQLNSVLFVQNPQPKISNDDMYTINEKGIEVDILVLLETLMK